MTEFERFSRIANDSKVLKDVKGIFSISLKFKGILRNLNGIFKESSRNFKEVSGIFKNLRGISRKFKEF